MEAFERLEAEWAAANGYTPEHVVTCASGTAALHLALEAFRLPLGSSVIVPDYTMVACPRAVVAAGLKPVFVDCDPDRLLMSESGFRSYRNSTAEAVMFVHVYGRRQDEWFFESAEDFHLKIVEDLSEAHGVRPSPLTDAACWSFYKNKIVAGEEGGAVAFKDVEHARYARMLRSLGFTSAHDYTHVPRGWNHRMSNIHAERILDGVNNRYGYLGGLKINSDRRREIEGWYDEFCPIGWKQPARDAVWVYDFRIRGLHRLSQTWIVRALQAAGIGARFGFVPMTLQDEFRIESEPLMKSHVRPNSFAAYPEVIYLPVQPGTTTRDDCRRAFEIVFGVLSEKSSSP